MDNTTAVGICWILVFMLPVWMVAILCIRCRNSAPTRITSYGDYMDSKQFSQGPADSSFTVIRPSNYQPPPSTHLLSLSPLPNSHRTSLLEVRESDNESLPNYENTAKEINDDEVDDAIQNCNYIVVIPDDAQTMKSPVTTSRTSHFNRISSGTIADDYENLKEESLTDMQGGSSNYVNIDEMDQEMVKDSEEEEDEDGGSDYVNSSNCALRR